MKPISLALPEFPAADGRVLRMPDRRAGHQADCTLVVTAVVGDNPRLRRRWGRAMVIYAAHWIASLLFLIAVGAVVAVLLWRFRVAVAYVLVTLIALAVVLGGGLYWWNERAAQAAREEARVAAQKKRDAELEQYKRDMQTLRESVVTALNAAKLDIRPPVPPFQTMEDRLAYLRWLGTMSERLSPE